MKFLTDHSINIQNVATGEERNTLLHWHMYPATELNMAPPEPKFIYEDTPGVDGSLDVTEDTADRVLYNDRNGEWEFYITNKPLDVPNIDDTISWAQMQSDLSNFLHGQKVKITLADDPNYYYLGRLNISGFDPNKHYQHVTIEYQADPYKYEIEEYDSGTRTVSTTDSVTAAGSPMAAIPTITINSYKFAFHQHNALTRAEAIYMLYNLSAAVSSSHTHWPVTITESKFLDVDPDEYYYDAVLWAEEYNITSGVTENIFAGNNVCTRAMFVTMLYAFNWQGDTPSVVSGNAYFSDVPVYSYYFNPVKWAYIEGYVAGDGDGHFMPNEPIKRETACAILYKYLGEPAYPSSADDDFTDLAGTVTIAPWYYVAVVKLYNEGIITGYADGTYKPGNYITRGQFVTMLYAAAGKPNVSMFSIPFTDVTSDMYCYNAVKYCYTHGYISGTSETTFSPERAMLRKEMLQVLFLFGNYQAIDNPNLEYFDPDGDEDSDATAASGIEAAADVPNTAYYYNAVIWGVMYGITTLNPGHMFYPDQKATRAMAAQMLYKLMKILNDWEDDDAATIDQEGSYTTITNDIACDTSSSNWRQGYYDSTQNDLISDNAYIRTIFFGLSNSDTYGTVTKVSVKFPSAYKYRIHWFSNVTSSTQTFISETSWITGTGANRSFNKPSNASHFMVSVTDAYNSGQAGQTITQDMSFTSSSDWRQGRIDPSTGSVDDSNTSYVYTSGYMSIADASLQYFDLKTTSGTLYVGLYCYGATRRTYLGMIGFKEIGASYDSVYGRIRVSALPEGTEMFRWSVTTSDATSPSDGTKLVITAVMTDESGGGEIDPSDGASSNILVFKTFSKTTYLPPVTDINKWRVDYTDAVLSCYNEEVIADPMLDRAPMKVTLENTKGTVSTMVEEKDSAVPELVVVDGENEFTVEGDGTYRIQFKRGSL